LTCTGCTGTKFLSASSSLCVDDCAGFFTDYVHLTCVLSCDLTTTFSTTIVASTITTNYCKSSCPDGYNSFEKICTKDCPVRSYNSAGSCIACSKNCYSCIGPTSIECSSCSSNYYLEKVPSQCSGLSSICINYKCNIFCENAALYRDATTWRCVTACKDDPNVFIIKSTLQCVGTRCPISPVIYNALGQQCVLTCPSGTYQNKYIAVVLLKNYDAYNCLDCDSKCLVCADNTSTNCSQCTTGNYLTGTLCDPECSDPDYTYIDKVNLVCQQSCP
jgi:hypothetical protein